MNELLTGVLTGLILLVVTIVVLLFVFGVIKVPRSRRVPSIVWIVIGLIISNIAVRFTLPWFWKAWAYSWITLIIFNIMLGLASYMFTVRIKDEHGNPTKEPDPTARKWASVLVVLLVLGVATSSWKEIKKARQKSQVAITPGFSPQLGGTQAESVNYILAVLDGCETGTGAPGSGRQFLDDGVTPVRNPQDAPWGTGAVGKWQINLSDQRVLGELKFLEAEMKLDGSLGPDESLDVERNETHNRAAAEYLYKKYGTAQWTASVACWADKITMPGGVVVTLEGPVGEWSAPFSPRQGFNFSTGWVGVGKPRHQIEYTLRDGGVVINEYPTKDGKNQIIKGEVAGFRVKSLEKKPVTVEITLTPS
ncbi:MAG: hypothetical protein COU10_03910 [Candidatus Harrisonbacteria bacterium CG10_big_fil_rev_8_21_14_0_10_45_28]|uniref:Uncharacterized protein n=1 Tax=Candidatus Harrisonbacteria bacterium CG10_big_fil_rev_8_21_14_0_10_45_28 TaxID=1974586 RepID=A0A2H0UMG3_9BACT|nr:MAG: hypothetical protein COU10_03910 [Candidatus Harrisonbacteria bacterium CG10_big_fil_rev_8_21_14_0_10_45_28]